MTGNPKLKANTLSVGHTRDLLVADNLTRTQIAQYAGAPGDFNPVHHDESFAKQVAGYPSVFAHGMLTMGLTGRVLTEYGVRFVRQVWPGDPLTARGTVTSIRKEGEQGIVELELVTENQNGEPVAQGSAVAALPLQ